jgi:predicted transcriptional regulator
VIITIVIDIIFIAVAIYLFRIGSRTDGPPNYVLMALEERLAKQDKRLAEIAVNYEILGAKVEALISNKSSNRVQKEIPDNDQIIMAHSFAKSNDSVRRILNALLNNDMTALQVMEMLGCTREHAARLMKQLTDKGLVTRISEKKPYVYRINEDGKKFLSN